MPDSKEDAARPYDFRKLFASDATAGPTAGAAAGAGAEPQRDPVAERCRLLSQQTQGEQPLYVHNVMHPCKGELTFPPCQPVDLPDIRPRIYLFWGASQCDCIESDDTEVVTILVYNPYRNLTLCNVEIARLQVVRADGQPITPLPDGGEPVQLVPRGLFCFGDVGPCQISYRQFSIRLRGARSGTYRILIEGICFELCLHRMTEECVTFDVCAD